MAVILNIETATDICSVCIAKEETILAYKESEDAYSHASVITLLIEACAKEAALKLKDLDAIAVSSGPGSYTALRVGAAAAKGMCYGLDKPLIVVDTLQALAKAANKEVGDDDTIYVPMIDARRMEVYLAIFDREMKRLAETQNVILEEQTFSEYLDKGKQIVFCGNGAPKSKPLYSAQNTTFSAIKCSAKHLVTHSFEAFKNQHFADIAYYAPNYLKAPNITVSKKIL